MEIERRFIDVKEIRAADEGMIIEGYPIVYNVEAEIGGWFRESIAKGAATNAFARSDEIVLFNHDSNFPLARKSNGTLTVTEDDHGVKINADVSGSARGRETHEMIKNGLISKMSFAFSVEKESWVTAPEDGGMDLRIIDEFREIFDYSPVTYPAYKQTEIQARSAEELKKSHDTATAEDESSTEPEEFNSWEVQAMDIELDLLGVKHD